MMSSNNGSVSSSPSSGTLPRDSLTEAVMGSLPRSCPRSLMSASQRDDAENLSPDELYRTTGTGQLTACLERFSLNDPGTATASTCDNSRASECGQEAFASVLAEFKRNTYQQPGSNGDDKQEYESRQQGKRAALQCVSRLARHAPAYLWQQHFQALFNRVLDQLVDVTCGGDGTLKSSNSISVREASLSTLTDMLRRDCVAPLFQPFAKTLFILAVLLQREKDLCRAAEECAAVAAVTLPPDTVVRVLNPLVPFPADQAAIKALTRMVEYSSADTVVSYLPSIMPNLLKAYDDDESSVRNAAVICMAAIHTLCGEAELRPHLASLNATKLKLLNLSIKRAQQMSTLSSSTPTTPE